MREEGDGGDSRQDEPVYTNSATPWMRRARDGRQVLPRKNGETTGSTADVSRGWVPNTAAQAERYRVRPCAWPSAGGALSLV